MYIESNTLRGVVGCGCGRHRRVAAVACEVVVAVVVVGNIDVDAAARHMHRFTKLLSSTSGTRVHTRTREALRLCAFEFHRCI